MNINKFLKNAKRVFLVAKKPNMKEFLAIAKSAGIGIAFLGFLGLLIYVIFHFFILA